MTSPSSSAAQTAPQPPAPQRPKGVDFSRPMWKLFLVFLLPMVLSNLLQSLSGTLNGIYVGQLLGVQAMAAAASAFPLIFFCISLVIGLGAGASVLIGQAWGARQLDKVQAITGTALALGLVLGGTVAVLGGLFTPQLMHLLGTPDNVMPLAVPYMRLMLLICPLIFLFLLMTSLLRGVGDTLSPMLALLLSTASSLVVTPTLIRWGLGLNSAAYATLVAHVLAIGWLAWRLALRPYQGQPHPMAPGAALWRQLRIQPALLQGILRIGLPTGVQMVVISLSEVAVLALVNRFGSDATAAYGAVNQIVNYVQFPAISIAISCSIIGAQAIGSGRVDKLGSVVKTGLLLNLLLTGTLVLIAYAFADPFIRLFIRDDGVVRLAESLMQPMLWSIVLMGMSGALSGVMRASGTVLVPTAISIAAIGLVQVPVAWWLSQRMGLQGVWYGYPVAFSAMLAMQAAFYALVWRKRAIRRLV